jgi:hypothetical protein
MGAAEACLRNAGTPMVAAVTPAVAAAVFKNLRRETFSSLILSSFIFLLIPSSFYKRVKIRKYPILIKASPELRRLTD